MDIFELVCSLLECDYISDLRQPDINQKAKVLVTFLDLRKLTDNEITEFLDYLYNSTLINT